MLYLAIVVFLWWYDNLCVCGSEKKKLACPQQRVVLKRMVFVIFNDC